MFHAHGHTAGAGVVEEALLAVVQLVAAEAALAAEAQARAQRDQVREVLGLILRQRGSLPIGRSSIRCRRPGEPLIARELEVRWDRALKHVEAVEKRIADHWAAALLRVDVEPVCFATLAQICS